MREETAGPAVDTRLPSQPYDTLAWRVARGAWRVAPASARGRRSRTTRYGC